MTSEKHITLPDGSHLNYLEKDPSIYFHKITLLYGESDSGKTTIIEEGMKLLQPYIPIWFVISPTDSSNGIYTSKLPACLIKKELKVEFLELLYKRQCYITEIYRKANKIPVLEGLFKRCADQQTLSIVQDINIRATKKIKRVQQDKSLNISMQQAHKKAIQKTLSEYLTVIYKKTITFNKHKLTNQTLSADEQITIKFLNLNPNIGLIMDDVAATIEKLAKRPVIKEMLYQGRHNFITAFIPFQGATDIGPNLRRNGRVSIFTTPESATTHFETKTNGHSSVVRKKAILAINACFEQDDKSKIKHHRKLVFIKNTADPFRYMVAELYGEFKLCCDAVWDLQKRLPLRSTEDRQKNNPIISQYLF